MNSLSHSRLDEFKIKASLLIKGLLSTERQKSEIAAARFLTLPFLRHRRAEDILNDKDFFRHKHALAVIAIENGCANWNALRTRIIIEDCLFYNTSPSFLNVWFNNYADAKAYREQNGGYLLQYRKDYIVAEKDYLEAIGLAHMEDDWQAIGYDWVKPADKTAWDRIFQLAKHNYLARKKIKPPVIDKSKRPAWLSS